MSKKQFAVIGYPLGHTMSPFIHRRLMAESGTDGEYRAVELPPEILRETLPKLRALDGFNVTIPHKEAILPLLGGADETARAFGSVNTVRSEKGRLTGYTTDGIGFRESLKAAGFSLGGKILLLGNGGVARVFANEAVRGSAAPDLTVVLRRRPEELPAEDEAAAGRFHARANRLVSELTEACTQAGKASFQITALDFQELEEKAKEGLLRFDLLLNATSVGMYPSLGVSPVSEAVVRCCGAVFDAIYNPKVTQLMRYALLNSIPVLGGMGMLVWQAAAAQTVWTGAHFTAAQVNPIIGEAQAEMQRRFGNVVLCGFMGCGKTTVGALLANALSREFVDMDDYIQQRAGRSIPELFAEDGEGAFRAMETEAARELSRRKGLVVATGGGCLLNPQNTALFRETGLTVFLDAPLPLIEERLRGDHSRPLLERDDRREAMKALFEARLPKYREAADETVAVRSTSEEAARALLNLLGGEDA